MSSIRQTSFAAGELDPKLWGRNDLSIFNHGLRHALNFFITKQGAAVSRPGTTYIGSIPTAHPVDPGEPDIVLADNIRLIPFHYSDAESAVFEFGPKYIRVWQNGAIVDSLSTNITSSQIWSIRYMQSGNVLWFVCGSGSLESLYTITRVSSASWVLDESLPGLVASGTIIDVDAATRTTGFMLRTDATMIGVTDTSHPDREWVWWYSAIRQDATTGVIYEEAARKVLLEFDSTTYPGVPAVTVRTSLPVYSDRAITLSRTAEAGAISGNRVLAWNIYRGRGDLGGFVGQTKTRDFVDVGETPDYSKQPPSSDLIFYVYDTDGSTVLDVAYPVCVGFFESRFVFGGTDLQPTRLYFSATNRLYDFAVRTLSPADGPLQFDLNMRRFERIQHLVSLEKLLIFTDSSVWAIGGHQGNPLSNDSVDAKVVEDIGCHDVAPLTFDGVAIYARRKGFGVRMVVPAQSLSGYQGISVSDHAQHLFGYRVVDWCYQEDPFGLIWVVREDGKLLSGTLDKASGHIAWCEHETDGIVESICSVPEDEEDAVYIVVQRTVNGATARHIERMTSRLQWPDDPTIDEICLDSVITSTATPSDTISGLSTLIGEEVYATGQGLAVYGPFTVSAAGTITLPETPAANNGVNLTIHVGRQYSCEMETLDVAHSSARLQQKGVTRVGFEVYDSTGLEVGTNEDNLVPWRQRQVSESYGIVGSATELVSVAVKGTYGLAARAFLRQPNPKHVTVVGITRLLEGGGT